MDMRGPLKQPVCSRTTWREDSGYDVVSGEALGRERLLGCNDERYADDPTILGGVAPSYPGKPEPCGQASKYFKPNAKYLANWRSACGHAGICPKCGGLAYQVWKNLDKIECSKCDWTGDGKEGGYEGPVGIPDVIEKNGIQWYMMACGHRQGNSPNSKYGLCPNCEFIARRGISIPIVHKHLLPEEIACKIGK